MSGSAWADVEVTRVPANQYVTDQIRPEIREDYDHAFNTRISILPDGQKGHPTENDLKVSAVHRSEIETIRDGFFGRYASLADLNQHEITLVYMVGAREALSAGDLKQAQEHYLTVVKNAAGPRIQVRDAFHSLYEISYQLNQMPLAYKALTEAANLGYKLMPWEVAASGEILAKSGFHEQASDRFKEANELMADFKCSPDPRWDEAATELKDNPESAFAQKLQSSESSWVYAPFSHPRVSFSPENIGRGTFKAKSQTDKGEVEVSLVVNHLGDVVCVLPSRIKAGSEYLNQVMDGVADMKFDTENLNREKYYGWTKTFTYTFVLRDYKWTWRDRQFRIRNGNLAVPNLKFQD